MIVNDPREYIKKNAGIWAMQAGIIFMYTLVVLLVYNLYFIRTYYISKEGIASEMKAKVDEIFKDGKYYTPEEVKMVPIMSRTISTTLDKDIVKTMNKKCENIELTLVVKTLDPLLLNRTDVGFEVENTGQDWKDCNFTITTQDKIK